MEEKLPHRRKNLSGVVKSDRMDKTRVVVVERTVRHPQYEKVLRKTKSYYVHDEKNSSHAGDRVRIESTRPLSRLKRWRLVAVLEKAR